MRWSTFLTYGLAFVASASELAPPDKIVRRELDTRSLASTIWNDIENAATCDACEAVLLLLKGVAELGDSSFVSVLTEICDLSGAEDSDVCSGAIALEGPIIAHDLRSFSIGSHTSKLFCVTFMGLCAYPDVTPYTVSFPSAKPSTSRPSPSGQTPIQIVQYSDVHVDPFYVTGSNTNCSKPICCRDYSTADSPGNNNYPAGAYGDHNCDTPTSLEESMYAAIASIAPNAKFALFTGDIVDHAVWNTTQAQNTIDINAAYGHMSGLPIVYGTVGNHEANPTNAFQPTAVGTNSQWVYNLLSSIWTKWIGVTAATAEESFGAYSVKYGSSNLRIISINTNMYYIQNYWLYESDMETDPSGQLAWLVTELQAAETAGERVYIIGHTPMGSSDAFHDASNYFDQIVNRYSNTIAAMFFGHTHDDEFEISYSDYSNRAFNTASAISYIMPSLTPTSGHPTFRVYTVDPVSFAVLDSVTYFADMTNPAYQTTGPVWTKYYSAKETYGALLSPAVSADDNTVELSPAFWHNVTTVFESSASAFAGYISRKSRGWNVASCTGSCQTEEICKVRAGRAEDNCVTPSFGVSFKKRWEANAVATGHRDECGISVSREVLAKMVTRRDMLETLARRMDEEVEVRKRTASERV
ncbi:sphingomyelin phosphodiesterase [Lepidopterella palustris CBS 459.81]|uniref:Sphingomyelin phosphodiesterase n=1 Tax=Lepidopterella palustris CBS 459.81 TaxID=1314670 RepID=A0A8E2E8M9_9PEZI|nr:sphingomyelin phosphodiesterase [Lepidopterella palustris CBS 459.81]